MREMRYRNGELEDLTPLLEALDLATRRNSIVSFIGAGGKRNIIEEIVREYEKNKRKIVVTTTTKVRKPFPHIVICEEDIKKVKEELKKHYVVVAGADNGDDSISVPSPEFLEQLRELNIPILVWADDGENFGLKVPQLRGNVIVPRTEVVVCSVGMDSIGKPLSDACYSPKTVAEILKTGEDIVTVLTASEGCLKNKLPKGMRLVVILNKMDASYQIEEVLSITKALEKHGIHDVFYFTEGDN